MPQLRARFTTVFVLLAALFSACGEPGAVSAPRAPSTLIGTTEETSSPKYLQCPVNTTQTVTGVIGALGGTLTLDGTSLIVPQGILSDDVQFRVTLPASRYMEVQVTAEGQERFDFALPATITIDYGRCSRTNILRTDLSVWYVDDATKAPLQHMGGVDDKLTRTVTFATDHLSTYIVAE